MPMENSRDSLLRTADITHVAVTMEDTTGRTGWAIRIGAQACFAEAQGQRIEVQQPTRQ